MDFWLLICLVLLIAPFIIIIGLEWLPFGRNDDGKKEPRIPADGLRELIALLKHNDTVILNDVSLVDLRNQKLETGLGSEKIITGQELREWMEQLPNSLIHYSNNQWVNRYWIQKIKNDELKLLNGRKVSFFEKDL